MTLNGVRWLLNRCYGMTLPVEREFPASVTWRASVAMAPGGATSIVPAKKTRRLRS
jgi:LacI family transcriptional regulator